MRNIIVAALMLFSVIVDSKPVLPEPADSIYLNGKIYTANDRQAWVEAVAIKDNKFVFVGSNKSVEAYIDSSTLTIDLHGKMAMPGIHDAHSHMLWGGLNKLFECRLPTGASLEKLIVKLQECARDQKPADWLIAGSLWSEQLPDNKFHKSYLDGGLS